MKPEQSEGWRERQRSYYDRFEHRYLAPSAGGRYAENITAKLWSMLSSDASSRGLELGCGAGRFTLPLLARCRSLAAATIHPPPRRADSGGMVSGGPRLGERPRWRVAREETHPVAVVAERG
jgi:hypothetical protein